MDDDNGGGDGFQAVPGVGRRIEGESILREKLKKKNVTIYLLEDFPIEFLEMSGSEMGISTGNCRIKWIP